MNTLWKHRSAKSGQWPERYALFDAVVAVLSVASADAPVVLILDDLHWAAKPTLLLLRHLLRFGEQWWSEGALEIASPAVCAATLETGGDAKMSTV